MTSELAEGAVPPRYRGRRRLASPARLAIKEAVRELLAVRRIDEVTVLEIVERAKIARPTFYAHFETKYSVVAALIADTGETIYRHWRPFFEGTGPVSQDELQGVCVATLGAWRSTATLFSATVEGWHNDQEIHDTWNVVFDRFVVALRARVAEVRPLEPEDDMIVPAMISVFERCIYTALTTPDSPFGRSDEELADAVSTIWVRSLRLAPAAPTSRRKHV